MPERILTRVDLPAPFSPTSTWTSPARRSNATSSRATTPGNRLDIPRSSRTGGGRLSDIMAPGECCCILVIRNAHRDGWRDPSLRNTTDHFVATPKDLSEIPRRVTYPRARLLPATLDTGRHSL